MTTLAPSQLDLRRHNSASTMYRWGFRKGPVSTFPPMPLTLIPLPHLVNAVKLAMDG